MSCAQRRMYHAREMTGALSGECGIRKMTDAQRRMYDAREMARALSGKCGMVGARSGRSNAREMAHALSGKCAPGWKVSVRPGKVSLYCLLFA
jgi:hypothetical protein